jgi:pyruvate-formate lyase
MPAPFLSLLVDDCIAKGKDYHDGGPRYNTTYIMAVAPGTCTDSLAAIKYHVFDRKTICPWPICWSARRQFRRSRERA